MVDLAAASATVLGGVAECGPVLAVVAHPDDESFGLGAILAALVAAGAAVRVVCLTYGEASTLGATPDLAEVRHRELTEAAERLGVAAVALHDFPDGRLSDIATGVVDAVVEASLGDAATLVAFEAGGVTGHCDHRAATASAHRVARRHRLTMVEWGVAATVAAALNAEFATTFVALDGDGSVDVAVDRAAQRAAIACHQSQARDNPVLARRLELAGLVERIRVRQPLRAVETVS